MSSQLYKQVFCLILFNFKFTISIKSKPFVAEKIIFWILQAISSFGNTALLNNKFK